VKFKLILRALWQMWRTVVYWPNFNQCDVTPGTKCPNFGEITRNNGHYVVQGHSRSPLPKNTGYNLRKRTHNLTLPTDISAVIKQNFVYIECCSETSINLVFTSHCYFASIITALHVMQTRYSDENFVHLSVCLSHAWSLTKRKKDLSKFVYHTKEHLS